MKVFWFFFSKKNRLLPSDPASATATTGTISIPSIRHSGANTRPACGEAASNATISGSASTACNCPAKHAASEGTSGNNHPNPRGSRPTPTERRTPLRPARGPETTQSRPARNRRSNPNIRPSTRRTRRQINTITAAANIPPAIRAATARHNPSRVSVRRSEMVRVSVRDMNEKRT